MPTIRTLFTFLALATLLSAEPRPPAPAARAAYDRAMPLVEAGQPKAGEAWAALAEAIEADPDFLPPHEAVDKVRESVRLAAFRNKDLEPTAKSLNEAIDARYVEWGKKFSDSIGLMFATASRLYNEEDPKAKDLLLKIVAHDPKFARGWFMLSIDAERWGDAKLGSDYMRRASEADPASPDYAFYYASGLRDAAPDLWEPAMRDVARRFPTSERGAQALYWLGARLADEDRQLAVWEQARKYFPPEKFSWTQNSMNNLFNAYLRTAPQKAQALATELSSGAGESAKQWKPRVDFAQAYMDVRALANAGQLAEALGLLDKLPVTARTANPALILLLKADVTAGVGQKQAAYDLLAQYYAKSPEDEILGGARKIGIQLGKNDAEVMADIWKLRDAAAKPAPAFDLGLYTSDKSLSLASLKGKVVFVTFWFPGCGPCRGEFPHFEKVVKKFKDNKDLVYLGINGIRKQDDYVLPFMQGTKYSFTPLKGGEIDKAYGVRGYPSNFLIDRDGRIVFENFRTDESNELLLQRMIESLLARPAGA